MHSHPLPTAIRHLPSSIRFLIELATNQAASLQQRESRGVSARAVF